MKGIKEMKNFIANRNAKEKVKSQFLIAYYIYTYKFITYICKHNFLFLVTHTYRLTKFKMRKKKSKNKIRKQVKTK